MARHEKSTGALSAYFNYHHCLIPVSDINRAGGCSVGGLTAYLNIRRGNDHPFYEGAHASDEV